MARLPTKAFQKMVPLLREKEFYEKENPRKIHWPSYTQTQISEAKETFAFICKAVDETKYFHKERKVGRPLTDPKSLAKAILICEALCFDEREAQGWLEILGPFLGIKEYLDDRVIGKAYDRPEVIFILKQVFENSKTSDRKLSGDGSGIETTRKQNYESTKKAGDYLTSIVDSREVVQAFDYTGKQECQAMHILIPLVEGDSLRLDAGFVDRKLVDEIQALGMTPFIFPKIILILNGHPAWKNMYMNLFLDVMEWLREYHQRSHAESFHSAFKRKNGIVRKRKWGAKLAQITARIILHNRERIAYFERIPTNQ